MELDELRIRPSGNRQTDNLIIIIIIAAFIMRTYPSSEDVQGATVLLPRSLDTILRPHFRHIHTQHILHILPGS